VHGERDRDEDAAGQDELGGAPAEDRAERQRDGERRQQPVDDRI